MARLSCWAREERAEALAQPASYLSESEFDLTDNGRIGVKKLERYAHALVALVGEA